MDPRADTRREAVAAGSARPPPPETEVADPRLQTAAVSVSPPQVRGIKVISVVRLVGSADTGAPATAPLVASP